MNDFDKKLEDFNKKLTCLDKKLSNRCDKIENDLKSKADRLQVQVALNEKVNIDDCENMLAKLKRLEVQESERKTEVLMKESYDKRMNILIHGLEEDSKIAFADFHIACLHDQTKVFFFRAGF